MPAPSLSPYQWATDTLFSNGPGAGTENTKVIPTSGQLAEGLVAGESFKAQHLNALLNQYGEWLEFLSNEVTNAIDGGFTGGDTDLRDRLGPAGIWEFTRVPAVDGSDELDPSGVTTGPVQFSTPARRFHFRREVTTSAGATTLVDLADFASFEGAMLLEYAVCGVIAGTGVAAFAERETYIIAASGGSATATQVESASDTAEAGGASAISGLSFLVSNAALPELTLAITDSSQPRTVRVAGWAEFTTLAESGVG